MSLGIASIWRIALQKAIITHNIHVSSYFSMRCHVLHRVSQEEKAFSGLTLAYLQTVLVAELQAERFLFLDQLKSLLHPAPGFQDQGLVAVAYLQTVLVAQLQAERFLFLV